jgi:hypothetical protein
VAVVVALVALQVPELSILAVLAAQVLSSLNTNNPQPMLCLTLMQLRFGNAQQVLIPLTT